jgi:hypothetical protein
MHVRVLPGFARFEGRLGTLMPRLAFERDLRWRATNGISSEDRRQMMIGMCAKATHDTGRIVAERRRRETK